MFGEHRQASRLRYSDRGHVRRRQHTQRLMKRVVMLFTIWWCPYVHANNAEEAGEWLATGRENAGENTVSCQARSVTVKKNIAVVVNVSRVPQARIRVPVTVNETARTGQRMGEAGLVTNIGTVHMSSRQTRRTERA